jgi:hypothetical protein
MIWQVAFADSRHLLTLNGNGTVYVLRLNPPARPAAKHLAGDPAFEDWVKVTAALKPAEQVREVERKLKELNAGFNEPIKWEYEGDGAVASFLVESDNVADLSPLRALPRLAYVSCSGSWLRKGRLADLSCLRGLHLKGLVCVRSQIEDLTPLEDMPLTSVACSATRVKDLSPLRGKVLTGLNCNSTQVADLSPLKGMPLSELQCMGTPVVDLEPLRGMKLTKLNCEGTRVRDLAPLAGMPLESLYMGGTEVTDLSPLKGMPLCQLHCRHPGGLDLTPLLGLPLKELNCDFRPERDAALLRSIKTLEKINGKPAAEFWKAIDAGHLRKKE